jgi:putative ATP-dependent endonuclease of OLD family
MHLSQLIIKNYRSIKNFDLKFKKGKNIIVGKNNSGKSNIIKAIDLILGEYSPTYQKSENITESDFNGGCVLNPIFIFCELTREANEDLNYNEIYNCFGYKYHVIDRYRDGTGKYVGNPARHNLRTSSVDNFCNDLDGIMNITDNDVSTCYCDPKLRNQQSFEDQLNDKYNFAFGFRASFTPNNKISKEIRFFYREDANHDWIMAFSAPIRVELLQSAIIPSFRDPSTELRINQWNWYGKLLKNYIDADNKELQHAFSGLKIASDGVFENLRIAINDSKVKVAFPNTKISFQFNPDKKIDVYKSALIYVDDGFNSLLQDKGSGIQSAVTIGLFHYYTRNIAHASCSLLAIEEPEVYLHPQARRVISDRIDEFLEGNKNQVIVTSHSPEFITTAHEDLNIILVKKNDSDGTTATNTTFNDSKEKQILVKVQNAEMFFADAVILVEGGEKYIIEAIAKFYGRIVKPDLGENWLNDLNFSVISVGGKSEFWTYYKKLNELKIKCYVLADFDFLLRCFSEFLTNLKAKPESINELNAIKSKLKIHDITLKKEIISEIEKFRNILAGHNYTFNEKDLKIKLKEPFKIKTLNQIDSEHHHVIREFSEKYRKMGIYILEKELEDYYTETCKKQTRGVNGKEEKPIYIVSQLVSDKQQIVELVDCGEYLDFLNRIHK